MNEFNSSSDESLLERLREGDPLAFSAIFYKYYRSLVLYCNSFITDRTECEDIVMNLFVKVWETREQLELRSLKSFLLRCVRHDCLDAIKHRKIEETYAAGILQTSNIKVSVLDHYLLYDELEKLINDTLDKLDPKSVRIFKMSRWEGMKYDDIARQLNISRRTVEVKITSVIRQLQEIINKHFPN